MTNPIPLSPPRQRNTRALLINQQRLTRDGLPLPRLLQSPYVALIWALVLSTVVATLALGRIRVPRTVPGVVVRGAPPLDSLTPVLLLAPSARRFARPGQLAVVDTGGTETFALTIASVEPSLPRASENGRWLSPSVAHDTSALVVRLEPCSHEHCLSLAAGTRYAATATLGTRSLASFAVPQS